MGGSRMARMSPVLIAALLLTAGCLGVGGEEETSPRPQKNVATASQGTGGLQGVVTDEAVQPVVGANVTLVEPNRTVQTGEDGSYAFSDVTPGAYAVAVHAPGFISVEREIDIRSGEVSTLDVIVTHKQTRDAFTQAFELAGFFECGVEVGWNVSGVPEPADSFYLGWATCATPNTLLPGGNATNDKFEHQFEFEPPVDTVVYEMVWEPNNQMSEWMTTRMEVRDFDNDNIGTIFRTQGPSPIHVRIDAPVWENLSANFTDACEEGEDAYCGHNFRDRGWPLQTRVFPAWQCASEQAGGCGVIQQPFTHVITAFYNQPAPQGYSAFEDAG